MQRKVRFRRIILIAYDPDYLPLWILPLITPSPTPWAFHVYVHKYVPRKIHLLPLSE